MNHASQNYFFNKKLINFSIDSNICSLYSTNCVSNFQNTPGDKIIDLMRYLFEWISKMNELNEIHLLGDMIEYLF